MSNILLTFDDGRHSREEKKNMKFNLGLILLNNLIRGKKRFEIIKFLKFLEKMPRIHTLKSKKYPEGWEKIEEKLMELTNKMRDVENEPHEGRRKVESLWPIFRLHHERSRYVYEMFYKKKEIPRDLYEYCLREKWADADLIAKWKKTGYEKLCCL